MQDVASKMPKDLQEALRALPGNDVRPWSPAPSLAPPFPSRARAPPRAMRPGMRACRGVAALRRGEVSPPWLVLAGIGVFACRMCLGACVRLCVRVWSVCTCVIPWTSATPSAVWTVGPGSRSGPLSPTAFSCAWTAPASTVDWGCTCLSCAACRWAPPWGPTPLSLCTTVVPPRCVCARVGVSGYCPGACATLTCFGLAHPPPPRLPCRHPPPTPHLLFLLLLLLLPLPSPLPPPPPPPPPRLPHSPPDGCLEATADPHNATGWQQAPASVFPEARPDGAAHHGQVRTPCPGGLSAAVRGCGRVACAPWLMRWACVGVATVLHSSVVCAGVRVWEPGNQRCFALLSALLVRASLIGPPCRPPPCTPTLPPSLADEVDNKVKPKRDKGGRRGDSESPPPESPRGGKSGKKTSSGKDKEKGLSSSDLLARLLVPSSSPTLSASLSSAPGSVSAVVLRPVRCPAQCQCFLLPTLCVGCVVPSAPCALPCTLGAFPVCFCLCPVLGALCSCSLSWCVAPSAVPCSVKSLFVHVCVWCLCACVIRRVPPILRSTHVRGAWIVPFAWVGC